jgi:hypothetical protein
VEKEVNRFLKPFLLLSLVEARFYGVMLLRREKFFVANGATEHFYVM